MHRHWTRALAIALLLAGGAAARARKRRLIRSVRSISSRRSRPAGLPT